MSAASSNASLCNGDKGAGFIVQASGKNYIAGLAASTPGNCTSTGATWSGANIMLYLNFIVTTISSVQQFTGGFAERAQLYPTPRNFGLPATDYGTTRSADFNGDGRADYARFSQNGAYLYFGNANTASTGTFTEAYTDYWGGLWFDPAEWQLITGNFDGNGNAQCPTCQDFIWLGATGMWMFYGHNDGSFTRRFHDFTQPFPLYFGADWQQTAVGDFDGDGRTDIGRLGNTGAWYYYGNANKTFTQDFRAYQSGYWFDTGAFGLAVADFNGDGRKDYARLGGTISYIYYGAANRAFTYGYQYYATGLNFGAPSTWETIVGNFNGDGREDYARIGATGAWVFYGLQYASNPFSPHFYEYVNLNFGQPSNWKTIVGDFTGDGKTDYARLGSHDAWFFYGTGAMGTWGDGYQVYNRDFGLPSPFASVAGDFTGNGSADYVRLGGVFGHVFVR